MAEAEPAHVNDKSNRTGQEKSPDCSLRAEDSAWPNALCFFLFNITISRVIASSNTA